LDGPGTNKNTHKIETKVLTHPSSQELPGTRETENSGTRITEEASQGEEAGLCLTPAENEKGNRQRKVDGRGKTAAGTRVPGTSGKEDQDLSKNKQIRKDRKRRIVLPYAGEGEGTAECGGL